MKCYPIGKSFKSIQDLFKLLNSSMMLKQKLYVEKADCGSLVIPVTRGIASKPLPLDRIVKVLRGHKNEFMLKSGSRMMDLEN